MRLPLVIAVIAAVLLAVLVVLLNVKYNEAVSLMENGRYADAIAVFEMLHGYKDSEENIAQCNEAILAGKYAAAAALAEQGETALAAMRFYELGEYSDASARSRALWSEATARSVIAASNESSFHSMVDYTIGLRADGTVVAAGDNKYGPNPKA